MKHFTVVLLGLCTCASIASAQDKLLIDLHDGRTISYEIDDIERIEATKLEDPWTRIVEFSEYHYQNDKSEVFGKQTMSFKRQNGEIYLVTPQGRMTQISGEPLSPYVSFTEYMTFYLLSADYAIYPLNSTQSDDPNYYNTSWSKTGIFAGDYAPLWQFVMDSHGAVSSQQPAHFGQYIQNHETNLAGDRVAFVRPYQTDYVGALFEMDLQTGATDTLVRDSSVNSVRYDESTGDLIYYSVGRYAKDQTVLREPGYYRYSRSTKSISLLIERKSLRFADPQFWNGFDISSDGRKLLVPHLSQYIPGIPTFIEHDLESGTVDTLAILFDPVDHNEVWGQYSNSDSLILYSISNRWGTGAVGFDVGIYNRNTRQATTIAVAPTADRPFAAPYPRWSPDDTAICYGGAVIPVNTLDYVGPFKVYIKPLKK